MIYGIMEVKRVQAILGDLKDIAYLMQKKALDEDCIVLCLFNGVELEANPLTTNVEKICQQYRNH